MVHYYESSAILFEEAVSVVSKSLNGWNSFILWYEHVIDAVIIWMAGNRKDGSRHGLRWHYVSVKQHIYCAKNWSDNCTCFSFILECSLSLLSYVLLCAGFQDISGPPVFPKAGHETGFNPHTSPTLPSWLSQQDLDYYVTKFQRTGFTGGLNYYRNLNLWDPFFYSLVYMFLCVEKLIPRHFHFHDSVQSQRYVLNLIHYFCK